MTGGASGLAAAVARVRSLQAPLGTPPPSTSGRAGGSPGGAFGLELARALTGGGGPPAPEPVGDVAPPAAGRWAAAIGSAARRHGVDPALVTAVVWTESGFDPDAVSEAGARGLMQLMPATAAELGVDPDDPVANLDGGTRFLASLLDRYGGRPDLALAAYHAGPARVDEARGIPPIPSTRAYVSRVLDRWNELRRTGGLSGGPSGATAALTAPAAHPDPSPISPTSPTEVHP